MASVFHNNMASVQQHLLTQRKHWHNINNGYGCKTWQGKINNEWLTGEDYLFIGKHLINIKINSTIELRTTNFVPFGRWTLGLSLGLTERPKLAEIILFSTVVRKILNPNVHFYRHTMTGYLSLTTPEILIRRREQHRYHTIMLIWERKISNKIRHDAKHQYAEIILLEYSFLVGISRNIFMRPSKNKELH